MERVRESAASVEREQPGLERVQRFESEQQFQIIKAPCTPPPETVQFDIIRPFWDTLFSNHKNIHI